MVKATLGCGYLNRAEARAVRSLLATPIEAVVILALPHLAEACGCGGGLPMSVHAKASTTVFVGTVEAVTGSMPKPIVATFLVDKTYRGRVERRTVVSGSGNSCDIAFARGETYLVYADEHGGVLLTHECTRTRPLSTAGEDVRYLDNLAVAKPQVLVYGDVFRGTAAKKGPPLETTLSLRAGEERRLSFTTDDR
jgi:hypothetical protein